MLNTIFCLFYMMTLKLDITRTRQHSQIFAATFGQLSPLIAVTDLQIKVCSRAIVTMSGEACDWYEGLYLDAKADQCKHTCYGPQVAELTVSPLTLPHSTAIQHGQPLHPCHHLHTQHYLKQLSVLWGIFACQATT